MKYGRQLGPVGRSHRERAAQRGGGASVCDVSWPSVCVLRSQPGSGPRQPRRHLVQRVRGAETGRADPRPRVWDPPPPAAGHSARSLGRSSRSVLSQCLKWGVSTPAPLLPEGTPGVPPPSPEVPGGLALHCTRLPSCCPLGQSCFPTSAIWGHLPNELFTLSQICCRGTQEDRDPMGLGAQCLPVG